MIRLHLPIYFLSFRGRSPQKAAWRELCRIIRHLERRTRQVKLKPDAPPPEFKATRVATPRSITELDPSTPPADASAIQVVTPSDIFSWPGPDVHLTGQSERTGIENNWYALTGRVVALKVEADGDLYIELQNATGDKPGVVIVEVPGAGRQFLQGIRGVERIESNSITGTFGCFFDY